MFIFFGEKGSLRNNFPVHCQVRKKKGLRDTLEAALPSGAIQGLLSIREVLSKPSLGQMRSFQAQ